MQVASLAAKVPSPTPTQIPPTPTPDETAAWKVYTDPVNHYSIKYPPTMYIIPLDSSDPSSAGGFSVTTKPNATTWLDADPSNQPYYQIEVAADPASKDTLDSMAATFDQYKTRPDYTRTIYTLDGVQGFKVTNISLDSLTDAVYVFKDGVQYSVGYRRFDKAIDTEGQVIFNKILSTFKFTN
jgi:hypothetical protein